MNIEEIFEDKQKACITREILEALPEWFEMPEGREKYIKDSCGKKFVCAYDEDKPIGFLYLSQTGKDTLELAVMGVRKEYHRMGIGKKLFERARYIAQKEGELPALPSGVLLFSDHCTCTVLFFPSQFPGNAAYPCGTCRKCHQCNYH